MRVLIGLLLLISSAINAETITVNKSNFRQQQLVIDILKLALSKSASEPEIIETPTFNTRPRSINEVKEGNITVIWAGTNTELEKQLLAVKIPIFKGMFGYRVFIIRKDEQEIFDTISELDDLRNFTAGQGRYWGNNAIMDENNIPMVTSNGHMSLFSMLQNKRFDYMTRGLHEPWVEDESYNEFGLAVEQNLLLVYPFAMYFFVSLDNKELAERIKNGMVQAIDDGSYDDLFYNHELIKNTVNKANLKERIIFKVPNSSLPSDVPVENKKYWLDFERMGFKTSPH